MKLKASSLRKNSIDKSLARLIIKKNWGRFKRLVFRNKRSGTTSGHVDNKNELCNYYEKLCQEFKNIAKIYKFLDSNYQNPLKKKDITLIS